MREGLIKVSDPPLHNRGNFLDSVVELDRRLLDYIVGLDTEINELVDGSVSVLQCVANANLGSVLENRYEGNKLMQVMSVNILH